MTHDLIASLVEQGEEVVAYTIGSSRTAAQRHSWFYDQPQYHLITREFNHVASIVVNHTLHALNDIRQAADFDIIHDNTGMLANLLAWTNLDRQLYPPVLVTLHGPIGVDEDLAGHEAISQAVDGSGNMYFNGISYDQLTVGPAKLADRLIGVAYNGLEASHYPFQARKAGYFLTLARFTRGKGQGMAVKLCRELGVNLRMAGSVGGLGSYQEIETMLDSDDEIVRRNDDFVFFKEEIWPYIDHERIEFVGNVGGRVKMDLISHAKALLFPIRWPEPFGMAIIEALATGTPVVAMARGALPEIIEHGVNGFLASSEAEFKEYMGKVGEIDPADCRESVIRRFSISQTASDYRHFYRKAIERSSR
jgi:glycosyltransferase involved in cell wall biosynthesis